MAVWNGTVMDLSAYVALWRLGRRRLQSEEDYRRFQALQARLILGYLDRHDLDVRGKLALDLGSGVGGYGMELANHGARVINLDLVKPSYQLVPGKSMAIGNALSIPLADGQIDLVFCASLIEHVCDPIGLLLEIQRVLRHGAYCYLSFPPFYSPRGGHEFSPFHYLGEDQAIRLTRHREHPQWVRELFRATANPKSFSDTYQGWGLYKMTIAKAKRLIRSTSLQMVDVSTRYLPLGVEKVPILGEIMTWHVQFLLKKPG
jgi:SAM-dependent methyltransferase